MTYTKQYLLNKPPAIAKDLEVWTYVVNKMTDNGNKEVSIQGLIKYYITKVKFLKK